MVSARRSRRLASQEPEVDTVDTGDIGLTYSPRRVIAKVARAWDVNAAIERARAGDTKYLHRLTKIKRTEILETVTARNTTLMTQNASLESRIEEVEREKREAEARALAAEKTSRRKRNIYTDAMQERIQQRIQERNATVATSSPYEPSPAEQIAPIAPSRALHTPHSTHDTERLTPSFIKASSGSGDSAIAGTPQHQLLLDHAQAPVSLSPVPTSFASEPITPAAAALLPPPQEESPQEQTVEQQPGSAPSTQNTPRPLWRRVLGAAATGILGALTPSNRKRAAEDEENEETTRPAKSQRLSSQGSEQPENVTPNTAEPAKSRRLYDTAKKSRTVSATGKRTFATQQPSGNVTPQDASHGSEQPHAVSTTRKLTFTTEQPSENVTPQHASQESEQQHTASGTRKRNFATQQLSENAPETTQRASTQLAQMDTPRGMMKTPRASLMPSTKKRRVPTSLSTVSEYSEYIEPISTVGAVTPSKPPQRRTVASARAARAGIPWTIGQKSSTVLPSKTTLSADTRFEKLERRRRLQEELDRLNKDEDVVEMESHRRKRVKVDSLVYIPHHRPGESSGTFRVPDIDSDDEMEVDDTVPERTNIFAEAEEVEKAAELLEWNWPDVGTRRLDEEEIDEETLGELVVDLEKKYAEWSAAIAV